ncbi:hypothetical protein SELMODRAFT_410454 [Selaginella moellendorffii]|uniref:Uncharacterized protein n=1 Tax=Selaginella moellendorffii TaxID=88036 RepID=D8RET4_SELML|nr:hypothetical protein SELMODRAFT_410454 [Selaginella moellendorffii]
MSISVCQKILAYGGEDIARCLLWVQQRHGNWPLVKTVRIQEEFIRLLSFEKMFWTLIPKILKKTIPRLVPFTKRFVKSLIWYWERFEVGGVAFTPGIAEFIENRIIHSVQVTKK